MNTKLIMYVIIGFAVLGALWFLFNIFSFQLVLFLLGFGAGYAFYILKDKLT